jgi:diadenosine tetraphosphate (Ap4A) HIT family hydrolase
MARSPLLDIPESQWIVSNALAFAVWDRFPVSPGHVLVVARRLVTSWFDAESQEQAAVLELVNAVKKHLDATLAPKPDGYNVGFNAGEAAGQTVMHLHMHVIPRYAGDVEDPRGGVRYVRGPNKTGTGTLSAMIHCAEYAQIREPRVTTVSLPVQHHVNPPPSRNTPNPARPPLASESQPKKESCCVCNKNWL